MLTTPRKEQRRKPDLRQINPAVEGPSSRSGATSSLRGVKRRSNRAPRRRLGGAANSVIFDRLGGRPERGGSCISLTLNKGCACSFPPFDDKRLRNAEDVRHGGGVDRRSDTRDHQIQKPQLVVTRTQSSRIRTLALDKLRTRNPVVISAISDLDQSAGLVPSNYSGMEWKPISTAPFGRDLELAVINYDGTHAPAFPCRRIFGGWTNAETNKQVDVRPTHWREWSRPGL